MSFYKKEKERERQLVIKLCKIDNSINYIDHYDYIDHFRLI